MVDNFNILDRKNILYIDSSSTPSSVDGSVTETELGRVVVPGAYVKNGNIIRMTSFWTFDNPSTTNTCHSKIYASSQIAANLIRWYFSTSPDRVHTPNRDLYLQNGNILAVDYGSSFTQYTSTTIPVKITTHTMGTDLPIIFTGYLNTATGGDTVTLNGYTVSVVY